MDILFALMNLQCWNRIRDQSAGDIPRDRHLASRLHDEIRRHLH